MAGSLPNHGRQRPLPTGTHRDGNRRLCPMDCFTARWKGDLGRPRASLFMFFGRYVSTNHGPSTVETSLDFRGSADKRPTKKGKQPISEQVQGSIPKNQLRVCMFQGTRCCYLCPLKTLQALLRPQQTSLRPREHLHRVYFLRTLLFE